MIGKNKTRSGKSVVGRSLGEAVVEGAATAPEQRVATPPPEVSPVTLAATTPEDPLTDFFVGDAELSEATAGGGEAFVPQEARTGTTVELLAFWVVDEEYAIDIVQIQEIIKVPTITEVPRAPAGVLGIISLRGTIVPILDLRVVLHLEPRPPTSQSRVLVLRGDGDPLGVLVDRVSSVVRIDREAIEPVPRTMQREMTELLSGVGRIGERMLIVLEPTTLLSMTETSE
jgi:purine-binding chemotaxis protein CheW